MILKVDFPSQLGDFIPIYLVGSHYKILSDVLVFRLSSVMDKLISSNQSAFLKGKLLVDGVVVMIVLVDLVKRSKKSYLHCKVNFKKAYDSINWSFLDYMLSKFGFMIRKGVGLESVCFLVILLSWLTIVDLRD